MSKPGDRTALVYYVNAHGFGHGARTSDILEAWAAMRPHDPVTIVTDLQPSFFIDRVGLANVAYRPGSFDGGLVQHDSIRADMAASRASVRLQNAEWDGWVAAESAYLKSMGPAVVASDISGVPMAAAHRAGIPSVGVGNFGWDWIYDDYRDDDPAWVECADRVRAAYAQADRLLRLPFAEPMKAFRSRVDVPVVATAGVRRRDEIAAATGIDAALTWVLLSFSSLGWTMEVARQVARLPGHAFFSVLPLAWPGSGIAYVDPAVFMFRDLVASCDLVVSKPGYGILSDCVANRKPIVHVVRTDFREYHVLVEAMDRHLRNQRIDQETLYRGDLTEALDRVMRNPEPPEPLACGGAGVVVDLLASYLEG